MKNFNPFRPKTRFRGIRKQKFRRNITQRQTRVNTVGLQKVYGSMEIQ